MNQYCFVHIPKNAGKAFAEEIRRWTKVKASSNILMSNYFTHNIEGFTFYGGHTFYRMLLLVMPIGVKYITLLRDPINRIYSHWKYLLDTGSIKRYGWNANPTLGRFIRDSRTKTLAANFQSRYLTAIYRPPIIGEQQWQYQHEIEMAKIVDDQDELAELALESLEDFTIVGTQERFQESVVATCKLMVGTSPPGVNIVRKDYYKLIESADMEFLLEHNQADIRIYNEYKDRRIAPR